MKRIKWPGQVAYRAVAFGAMALMVVLLVERLREARAEYRELVEASAVPAVGTYVRQISVRSWLGVDMTVGQASASGLQVLYVFNTSCALCLGSLPQAERLARLVAKDPSLAFQGISTSADAETQLYAASNGISFPFVSLSDGRVQTHLRVKGVPAIITVDDGGRVVWSHVGAPGIGAVADSLGAFMTVGLKKHKGEAEWNEY